MPRALILDCEGARPTADEKALFRDADPWGFILFARHCPSSEEARALSTELRDCVGRDAPILIDQEGGRVARMKPPAFPEHPAPAVFGRLFKLDPAKALEAAHLNARLIGRLVSDAGVSIDCAPMLDVPQVDSDRTVIGDRALATHPDQIIALGRAVIDGLMEGGALPVIKHMPGHGRATVDSHYDLPRVVASKRDLRNVDFAPFKALAAAPIGMTAHIVYEAFDAERCGTMSPTIINDVIRGEIGFDGLLLSDDLKMQALGGPVGARVSDCLAAGVDIACCCNFSLAEKAEAAAHAVELSGLSLARAERALAARPTTILRSDTAKDYERLAGLIRPALVA
ncbi:MAG: glycoside hydrolase family 3 protein [Parvularculaceae bacterium]|nr:glycoside hydrolase family 3 protein [Parvularculaceae bacterium]